jgi:hypothetical protein
MGMTRDMKERKTLARIDDETQRWNIKMARDIIYNKNFAVNTPAVEEMLWPQSLVPTAVSAKSIPTVTNVDLCYRMPSRTGLRLLVSTYT